MKSTFFVIFHEISILLLTFRQNQNFPPRFFDEISVILQSSEEIKLSSTFFDQNRNFFCNPLTKSAFFCDLFMKLAFFATVFSCIKPYNSSIHTYNCSLRKKKKKEIVQCTAKMYKLETMKDRISLRILHTYLVYFLSHEYKKENFKFLSNLLKIFRGHSGALWTKNPLFLFP